MSVYYPGGREPPSGRGKNRRRCPGANDHSAVPGGSNDPRGNFPSHGASWLFAGRVSPVDPSAAGIGDPRNTRIRGFFVFGIAFGAASLSCTLPIFLVVVGSAVAATSFVAGLVQFFSYSLGIGFVILALTLGVALFREGLIVGKIRKVMPYVQHVTAGILVLAGSYIVYYWLFKGGLISYLT